MRGRSTLQKSYTYREKDLHFSVKYQWDPAPGRGGYAGKLKKQDCNTVFLQFDGGDRSRFMRLYVDRLYDGTEEKAVLNCSGSRACITLVPVHCARSKWYAGRDILKFGLDHMPLCSWQYIFSLQLFWQMFPEAPPRIHHHTKDAEAYWRTDRGTDENWGFCRRRRRESLLLLSLTSYLRKGEQKLKLLKKKKNQEKDAAVLPVMIPGSMWKISGATVQNLWWGRNDTGQMR